MLKQRVITALVLMAVLLPSLFASSPLPFVVLALVMISAAGWEWARLNGWAAALPAIGSGLLLAVACALSYRQPGLLEGAGLWELAALLWIVGGAVALYAGPAGWPRVPKAVRLALGLLLLWLGWAAVARSRII
ncbi:MAG: phosphatidate cytidylyltransferase, partial [Burkholderiales bacterium]|nr:phosphatidate cytidylyltransferase [Burkholderiales bacterium]